MNAALGIFLAIMVGGGANAGPDGKEVPRVAFLGFEFINTSLEATARVEVERIRLLDDVLRQKLTASRVLRSSTFRRTRSRRSHRDPPSATATAASASSRRGSARTGPRGAPCRR